MFCSRSLCRGDLSDRDFYSSFLELVKLSQTMIDSGSAGKPSLDRPFWNACVAEALA
jgi:hypothetical protein